jgi:predicted SprT family Zn-dependent metalloprotease
MIVYDTTTLAFIQKTEQMFREILQECNVTVRRSRFLWNNYLYPIHVVVFEGKEWGHFNAPYFQIGLNRRLIWSAKDSVVRDIIRHELAHYLTLLEFGADISSHGKEFYDICRRFNFPDSVSAATMNLTEENEAKEGDLHSEKILSKVQKLLSLAQSSNAHEAEMATLKANALLLRHNLDYIEKEETLYLDRLLVRSRKDDKMTAIYEILRHFIVRPVISMGRGTVCLEVTGTKTNVMLARYVAEFLDRELDHQWDIARIEYGLSGLRAKNSFFLGMARGFDEKMKGVKQEFSADDQLALVKVEKSLEENIRLIYRRLGTVSSGRQTDHEAQEAGKEKGRKLSIRHGVEGKAKNLYLGIFK